MRQDIAPSFQWGRVKPESVGLLIAIDGGVAVCDFPEQTGWRAKLKELAFVPDPALVSDVFL